VPLKKAADTASRAGGAIERFIERTLAPRLEEVAGELRSVRGEMQQLETRLTEGLTSLRNEMRTESRAVNGRIDSLGEQVNARINGLSDQVNARISGPSDQINALLEGLGGQLNTRIDALSQRLDYALNVRERLVALETKFAARNN
jgi:DNA anti-recombination protein RmuC